ncbi:hypothetical protein [Sphingomonas sp. Leaf37]|uniref:hypothetical protein n=1 Tax=Sphingomonas sp. Leaf37 TaxID=2876552 RepID=UPI001E3A08B7|nr:hypothetical protein [Sphingomonas sp. Leaf37]
MSGYVTPEAGEMLMLMTDEVILPPDWETSGFWLTHAQQLAQLMADMRGHMSLDHAALLAAIGGMMVEMARREREASDATACLMDRAAKGGKA